MQWTSSVALGHSPFCTSTPGGASVSRLLHSQVALWSPQGPCFATMQAKQRWNRTGTLWTVYRCRSCSIHLNSSSPAMMQMAFQHAAGPHTDDGKNNKMSWPRCADWLLDKGCFVATFGYVLSCQMLFCGSAIHVVNLLHLMICCKRPVQLCMTADKGTHCNQLPDELAGTLYRGE